MIPGIVSGLSVDQGPWNPGRLGIPPSFWVDDTTAVTDAGSGACSQWNDRSGNAFNLTQGTAGSRPLIVASGLDSKRTIRFDGSNDFMGAAGALSTAFRNVSSGWIMSLHKKTAADVSATQRSLLHCSTGGAATTVRASLSASLSTGVANAPAVAARRLDGDGSSAVASDTTNRGTNWLLVLGTFDWTNRTGTNYVNGAQVAQTTAIGALGGATSNTAALAFNLGGASSALAQADVEVAEVLAGWGYLPTSDEVDKLFGYLAWKWGQEGSLPGGHPYAGAPP